MENKELTKKVIENVRNRVVISNLESEENMKLNKRKQILSLVAVMTIMLTGSFFTVNAATNGELANKVKDTVKVISVKDDGKEEDVKGTTYTDLNNHIIEKYETNENGIEHTLQIDKTNLDEENLVVKETIKDDQITLEFENK